MEFHYSILITVLYVLNTPRKYKHMLFSGWFCFLKKLGWNYNTPFVQTFSIKVNYKQMSLLFLINCTPKKNSTQLINWDVCTSFECWFQQTNNIKALYDIKKLPLIWLDGVMILRLCKKICLLFKETYISF